MSSAFLQQAVAENSSKHTQLLESLSELEGIPDALKNQTKLLDSIQSELEECGNNVARLLENIRKERRNADPGIIPGGLKFSQVFRGKKEKEREREREERIKRLVDEAIAEETRERRRQASLEQDLREAQASKTELLRKMNNYDDIMGKIDALYGLIFNGPTPGYPNEDELEQSVQASYSVVERARALYHSENEGLEILSRADKTFKECQTKLKDAIYWATASMLAGGRTAEAKETSSLRIAHTLAQKAQAQVREAQQFSAHIRTLENPSIARELPVRKENDTEFHEVLKASAAELGNTYSQLLSERRASTDRTSEARAAVLEAEQTVADRKKELRDLRKATFLELVSKLKSGEIAEPTDLDFATLQDAPPSYALQPPPQSPGGTRMYTPLPPPELSIQKPRMSMSSNFGAAPAYESGPASPVSTYTAASHHSAYSADYALPTTPRPSSRPGGARPPRPLPRVPQSSSSVSRS